MQVEHQGGGPSYFPPAAEPEQSLLDELEESMPQGVANDTGLAGGPPDEPEDLLDSLDVLLSESMKDAEEKAQYKRDAEARKRGFVGLTKEEVDFCNSRLRAFEMAREWEADRCIAVFINYVCANCQEGQLVFSRLMEHHQHRRNATTHRWVTVKESKFPLETVYDEKEVALCRKCAVETLGMDDPLSEDVPWFEEVINDREE